MSFSDLLAGIFVPAKDGIDGPVVMVVLTLLMVAVVVWIAGGLIEAYEAARHRGRAERSRGRAGGALDEGGDDDTHSPRQR